MEQYNDRPIESIRYTKYKIVVPTERDRIDLKEAFEHLHNSDCDTNYVPVNQLIHEYLGREEYDSKIIGNIVVDRNLYDELNQGKSSDDTKSAISKVGHMLESFNNMLKDVQQSIKQTIRDFSDFNYLQGKNGLEPISWEDYLKEYGFSDEYKE